MKLDLVDVFGCEPLKGNPLAVVHGAEGMDGDAMLALTQWLGFSETTFLLPPTNPAADYKVRIFYPAGELPFAGHPTLGSCHAWLQAGGRPRNPGVVIQECGAGNIEVRQTGEQLAFKAPELTRSGPMSESGRSEAARIAGVDPDWIVEAVHVANGPNWQLLRLRSADDVMAAIPAAKAPAGTDVGLAGPHPTGHALQWELRAFFANQHGSIVEDPVTGSFNAGVAMHLFGSGLAKGSYKAGQGRATGADGVVTCNMDDSGEIWIGGSCFMISHGGELK